MHYKDGTAAMVGDLVKGTVYNTKAADGTPRVIVGTMLGITEGTSACNCRVLLAVNEEAGALPDYAMMVLTSNGMRSVHFEYEPGGAKPVKSLVGGKVDYSQCDHLELVHRPGESAEARADRIARRMWRAYSAQAGGVTFDGKPLPSWEELGEERQACWKAAAAV